MRQTLYEALGGRATLARVHRIFYDKVYLHPWLGQFFTGHDQRAIEDRQTSFMGEKMGGPPYIGKPVAQVHENMYIPHELYELRHRLLAESIEEAGIRSDLARRWLRIDAAFHRQIANDSITSFYRDHRFTYKRRIIVPRPPGIGG